jgi:hypothetical protein
VTELLCVVVCFPARLAYLSTKTTLTVTVPVTVTVTRETFSIHIHVFMLTDDVQAYAAFMCS